MIWNGRPLRRRRRVGRRLLSRLCVAYCGAMAEIHTDHVTHNECVTKRRVRRGIPEDIHEILENTQLRDLARIVRLSLCMTNAILNRVRKKVLLFGRYLIEAY